MVVFYLCKKFKKFIHLPVDGLCCLWVVTVLTSAETGLRPQPSTNFKNTLGPEADLKNLSCYRPSYMGGWTDGLIAYPSNLPNT